jgi:hypothetical protein
MSSVMTPGGGSTPGTLIYGKYSKKESKPRAGQRELPRFFSARPGPGVSRLRAFRLRRAMGVRRQGSRVRGQHEDGTFPNGLAPFTLGERLRATITVDEFPLVVIDPSHHVLSESIERNNIDSRECAERLH